jgi:Kef-type K+ transport system membrane component KefB
VLSGWAFMVPTIQILVLLLVIVASVAVVAARLKVPPAILLVLTGIALATRPWSANDRAFPGVGSAPGVATCHILVRGDDELA